MQLIIPDLTRDWRWAYRRYISSDELIVEELRPVRKRKRRDSRLRILCALSIAALLLATVGPSLAAELVATDGDTFQLDRTIYRLDGVDAPEIDQRCLDQSGDIWPCGVTARDRLSAYIGNRAVRCEDKGPDPVHKHRRIGICSIENEAKT